MIDGALYRAWLDLGCHGAGTVLVHGDCPTGADAIADRLWAERAPRCPIERHPADWSIGRSAGFRRNAEMVELGASICLAFIGDCTSPRCSEPRPHNSHGATHTAYLAEAAGIEVRRFYASTQEVTS